MQVSVVILETGHFLGATASHWSSRSRGGRGTFGEVFLAAWRRRSHTRKPVLVCSPAGRCHNSLGRMAAK